MSSPDVRFAILAFSSLFSVINPISAASIFVSMTDGLSPGDRSRSARRACVAAFAMLATFAGAGGAIFALFGITVPAFQIAGGILFLLMSIDTLNTGKEDVPEEGERGADPSIVPLGIPLIAGPGAASTVMVLMGQAEGPMSRLSVGAAIVANIVLTFAILVAAPRLVERLGKTGQKIISKVMGLITAVIGVQFILNGVTTVVMDMVRTIRTGS